MPRSAPRKKNVQSSRTSRKTGHLDSDIKPCGVLHGNIGSYKVQNFRFTGCFGKVAVCRDLNTKKFTAVKIFKKTARGSQGPNRELAMLKKICGLNPENIVRFYENFEHKGYTCLAFELLDKNLHELLKKRRGKPLSLEEIKPITQQLLSALDSLKTAGVIHTNITPENVLFVKPNQHFRVKLIGFGSAVTAAEVKRGDIMQPVQYRSPDVILGLPITEAIDMWSLGCVLATMYLGSLPFPQRCKYYMMQTMVETFGQPEDELLSDGAHTSLYFSPNTGSTKPAWRLKTAAEARVKPLEHRGSSSSLGDLLVENPTNAQIFVSLLRKMLCLNPQRRITPREALIHPFITGSKLDDDEDSLLAQSEEEDFTSVSDLSDDEPLDAGEAATVDRADSPSHVTAASSDDALVTSVMSSETDVSAGESQEEIIAGDQREEIIAGDQREEIIAGDQQEEVSSGEPQEELSAADQQEEIIAGDQREDIIAGDPQEEVAAELLPPDGEAADAVPDAATGPAAEDDSAVTSPPPDSHHSSDGASSPSRNPRKRRFRKFFSRMFKTLCCCCCSTNV